MFPAFDLPLEPRRPSLSTGEATNPLSYLHAPSATPPYPLPPILRNTAATATAVTSTLFPTERFSDLPGHQPHQFFVEPHILGKEISIHPPTTLDKLLTYLCNDFISPIICHRLSLDLRAVNSTTIPCRPLMSITLRSRSRMTVIWLAPFLT